jgi:hypothetical protein
MKVLRRPVESALNATIRMVHQPVEILVTTYPDRHLQRVQRKIRAQVIGNLPADNPAGIQIHNE